jgi:hypothetical protein
MPLFCLKIDTYFYHGCYCKILPDLNLGNFITYSVNYFWVKPILGGHLLLILATNHRINFSELL